MPGHLGQSMTSQAGSLTVNIGKKMQIACLMDFDLLLYILLTVHLDVILVSDQLDALFLSVFI